MNRPLSPFEHFDWLLDQAVSQNNCFILRLSKPVKENDLRQALNLVQQKNPPLRCKVKGGEFPEFSSEEVHEIPLKVLKRRSDNHWLKVTAREVHKSCDCKKGPLASCIALISQEKCDIVLVLNHIIADGLSGIAVSKDVLTILGQLSIGKEVNALPPLPQRLATFDLIRQDLTFDSTNNDDLNNNRDARPLLLGGDSSVPNKHRISHIFPQILSKSETTKLALRCKEEKVTVHSAICASVLQAVVEEAKRTQSPMDGPIYIGCSSPRSIRHLLIENVETDMGNFFSHILHFQMIDDRSTLWEAARDVKQAFENVVKSGKDIETTRNISDSLNRTKDPDEMLKMFSETLSSIPISNIGILNLPGKFEDIILEEIHISAAFNYASLSGFGAIALTLDGRLIMDFHYIKPYLARKRAKRMIDSTMKRLKNL